MNINKNWIITFVLLILSIFLTVFIVQKQTSLNPEAASTNITFSGLSVSGNKLLNQQGQQVVLHGVNRSGTEFECVGGNSIFNGPNDAASIQAMRAWNIDVVRVPLNEDCWLGINGVTNGGAIYQQAIENYVNTLNQLGMYVILDLHWNAPGTMIATGQKDMADIDHSPEFWTSVANVFKNNTTVIFDLYNEPHNISWNCWKDSSRGNCGTYAGMQQLINAVRMTGAKNVVMAGGLSYASDLSQWLAYKPNDQTGNLVASWHMYGNAGCEGSGICWNQSLMTNLITQVPVIAGEFGESPKGDVCGTNIIDAFMNWLDQRQTSYLAWTWNTWGTDCGNLAAINDYTGTPKSPNGIAIKSHYLALGTTIVGPATISNVQPTTTPTPINPTFGAIGDCQTLGTCPTGAQFNSPIVSQNPVSASPTSEQPCTNTQNSAVNSMNNQQNTGSKDFLQLIFQFLQQLLLLLQQLFGGVTTTPTPALQQPAQTQPSQEVQPSSSPNISQSPCPSGSIPQPTIQANATAVPPQQPTSSPSNLTYIAMGTVPVTGLTVGATFYGATDTPVNGHYVISNLIQGGVTDGGAYNGFDDNGVGACGGKYNNLTNQSTWAENGTPGNINNGVLGNLPCGTKLAITYHGHTIIVEKGDISDGGCSGSDCPVNGHLRAVDLWWQTAKILCFWNQPDLVTIHVVPTRTPTSTINPVYSANNPLTTAICN
jgi:hypothetical protein